VNNYKVLADPRVELDLIDAKNFLESRRQGLGKQFSKEYKACLKTLNTVTFNNPRYDDICCLPMPNFKYMIHFQTNYPNNSVTIKALISTHQNPNDAWL
jgi:hypothetical protein